MGPVGQQLSSSCGLFATSSTFYIDITNLTVTITTSGRPVMVMLQPDGSATSMFTAVTSTTGTLPVSANIKLVRGASDVAFWEAGLQASATDSTILPAILFVDAPAAGTYTYKLRGLLNDASGLLKVGYASLVAYEL
jgi:hypothetical protein